MSSVENESLRGNCGALVGTGIVDVIFESLSRSIEDPCSRRPEGADPFKI